MSDHAGVVSSTNTFFNLLTVLLSQSKNSKHICMYPYKNKKFKIMLKYLFFSDTTEVGW